jgi:hypothetical protein
MLALTFNLVNGEVGYLDNLINKRRQLHARDLHTSRGRQSQLPPTAATLLAATLLAGRRRLCRLVVSAMPAGVHMRSSHGEIQQAMYYTYCLHAQ